MDSVAGVASVLVVGFIGTVSVVFNVVVFGAVGVVFCTITRSFDMVAGVLVMVPVAFTALPFTTDALDS